MALRTVGVRLQAEVSGYMNGLRQARTATRDFVGDLDRAAKAGKLDAVANQATRLGLVASAGFAVAVGAMARFDKQMSEVGAVSNATGGQLERLRQAALDAGQATMFSATDAARAEAELAKAGISTADILGGALTGSLDLAAAGSLDLAEAADVAAKTMNVFGLSGQGVTHIADVLAASANKSATDVHEMGEALRMGGLVAKQSGLSLEDTVGTLSAFADRALVGSDAGTSLKTMLQMIAAPSDKAAGLMKDLGINLYDAQGNFVGVEKTAGILQQRLGGLTQQQRNATLAQLFGADAVRGATVLYELGADGVQKYIDAVDDSGAAAETARKKTDNLAGDVERLTGSLETMAIEAGSGANTGLRTLVQGADAAVSAFSDLPGPVQSTITVLAGVSGAGLLATGGLLKVKATVGDAMQALRDVGPAGVKAADGLGKIGKVGGTLGAAGAGALLAYEGFKALGGWIDSWTAPVVRDVDKMKTSLKEFGETGKVTGELAKAFGKDLSGLGRDLEILSRTSVVLDKIAQKPMSAVYAGRGAGQAPLAGVKAQAEVERKQAAEDLRVIDKSLADLANSGNATAAKVMFDQLAASSGLAMDKLPLYSEAARGAAKANTGLASGFGTVGSNAQTMAGSLQEAIEKGQTLLDVWKQLNGATLSFDESQLRAKDALDQVKAAFKENGKEIEGNSRAAVENRVAVGEFAQAAADAAQKKYEETGSIQAANDVYDDYMVQLRKTLHDAGLTDAQIDTLIKTYGKIPPAKKTTVTADTSQAIAAAKAVVARINNMHARINVSAEPHGSYGGSAHTGEGYSTGYRWGGVVEHAQTGLINLRSAGIYSPQGPARYAFAEPATGGELFAPKNGDLNRTRAMVGYAIENWWGGWRRFLPQVAASGTNGGGMVIENLNLRAYSDRFSMEQVRQELAMAGVR